MNRKEAVRRIKKAFDASRKQAARGAAIAMKAGLEASSRGMAAGSRSMKAGMKAGGKKLKKAERSGALAKWKTRVGLGLQALEFAALATAAYKGVSVGKSRAAAKRARRAPAKRKAAR